MEQVSVNRGIIMKYKFSAIFLLVLLFPACSSAQNYSERIYNSYISGDMTDWAEVLIDLEDIVDKTGSIQTRYELSIAQYGYIAFSLIKNDKKAARIILDDAEKNIEKLLKYNENWARVHALSGALYGLKVGIDPYKAVFYGRRAFTKNVVAMELAPSDPQVWMEKGNLELHKPEIFGKNIELAIEAYNRSISLFELEKKESSRNWLYLNTLIGLAEAYTEAGLYVEADKTFRKILQLEANLVWIRDRDYPRFREKYFG